MRHSKLLLPLLSLTAVSVSQSQTSDADDAAAQMKLFQRCGGVAARPLPRGVTPGIYRGMMGAQAITLELKGDGSQEGQMAADRYAYDRHGVAIALDRGRAADRTANYSLLGVESVFQGDGYSVRGCLSLTADAGKLNGQWFTPDGKKKLPVALARVNVAAAPLALPNSPELTRLRASDPFTFLALNRAWTKTAGGLKEPLTGVTYPRVPGAAPALNAALQDGQLKLAADALDCLSGGGVNLQNGTDYSGSGTLSWKSSHLVSLHENVEYYCGGAYPDNYMAGVTLDARSGRAVTLLGKPGTLWPGLSALKLQALYLARYSGTDVDAECRDEVAGAVGNDTEYGFPYALYLTRQGLAVWPNYLPHVTSACAEVVTVPYASLRTLADPKSVYFRDLYPR
ncbi:hypothetical protein [Deinococcus altitudinis]|uniref:hypothetical protein n=1 Tax=Deinococcus altitudinis TaxID=468914 RepID=UPI003891495B